LFRNIVQKANYGLSNFLISGKMKKEKIIETYMLKDDMVHDMYIYFLEHYFTNLSWIEYKKKIDIKFEYHSTRTLNTNPQTPDTLNPPRLNPRR